MTETKKKTIDTTDWYVDRGKIAPDGAPFFQDLSLTIQKEFIDQLKLPKEAKINVGPFTSSYRNTQNHNVLFSVTLVNTIEVGFVNNQNAVNFNQKVKPKQNFYVQPASYSNKHFTIKGIIGYINEVWAPDQAKKQKRIDKRKEAQGELAKDVKDLAQLEFDYYNIPPALDGWINQGHKNHTISRDVLKYHVIADSETLKTIKTLKKKYTPFKGNTYYSRNGEKPKHFKALILVTRSDRNMAKIMSLDIEATKNGGYYSYWRLLQEGNWFAPKNTMKQLEKYVNQKPTLTALLYDPGKSSQATQ